MAPRIAGGERPRGELHHDRRPRPDARVLPPRQASRTRRQLPRGEPAHRGVAARQRVAADLRAVHQRVGLVVPDGSDRARPQDQRPDRAALGLGERPWAGVVQRSRRPDEAAADRAVAVQVDAVRVDARVPADAIGIEVAHENQLDARRRRPAPEDVHHGPASGLVAVDASDDEHLARRGGIAAAHDLDRSPEHRGSDPLHPRRRSGDSRRSDGSRWRRRRRVHLLLRRRGRRDGCDGCDERHGRAGPPQRPPRHRRSASVVTTAS